MTLEKEEPVVTTEEAGKSSESGKSTAEAEALAKKAKDAAATNANTQENASEELDEEGDWISKTPLDENQKKFIRRVITQNKNKKAALDEATKKLSTYETAKEAEERKRDEEQGNWKKIAADVEAKLKAKDERLMRAEVRNHAIKDGMIDPSLIDILPLDGVSMNEAGDVLGADKLIGKYKKEKAYLFGKVEKDPEGTTTTKTMPAPNISATPKDALKMDDIEWKAALKKFKEDNR